MRRIALICRRRWLPFIGGIAGGDGVARIHVRFIKRLATLELKSVNKWLVKRLLEIIDLILLACSVLRFSSGVIISRIAQNVLFVRLKLRTLKGGDLNGGKRGQIATLRNVNLSAFSARRS